MASNADKSEPAKTVAPVVSAKSTPMQSAPGGITPEMSADEAVDILYQNALRELEEEDPDGEPDDGGTPLSEADHARVRAFIRAGFRPGMSREEGAELQEAAIQDLLRALEFGLDGSLQALLQAVSGLGEVIGRIKEARQSATASS